MGELVIVVEIAGLEFQAAREPFKGLFKHLLVVKGQRRQLIDGKPTGHTGVVAALDILDGLDRGTGVDGLVFPELAEMNRHTVGRILGKWAEDAGVRKKVRFHVSRHTCATMQLSLGVGLMTIRDQLGHKTTTMTQVYAEVMDEDRRKAADVQGDAWSKL